VYISWQLTRTAYGNSLIGKLDKIEGKLDYILMTVRGDDVEAPTTNGTLAQISQWKRRSPF